MANQRALIDIDMLLDTRYGTMVRMDPDMAEIIASTEYYRFRQHDNFETVSNGEITWEAFKKLHTARDVETLFHSKMTDFVYELRKDIKAALPALDRGVEFDVLHIYVNFFPYDLTEGEREIIVQSIQHYMPMPTQVHGANIPWKSLTPAMIERQFEMVAIYDHEDWLSHHTQTLLQHAIVANTIMTPRISPLGVDPKGEAGYNDPFGCRAAVLLEWVSLVHLPTSWVCYNSAMFQAIHSRQYSEPVPPEHPPQEPASPEVTQVLQ